MLPGYGLVTDPFRVMHRIFKDIFPQKCVLCGLSSGESRICELCRNILPRSDCYCHRCGQPMASAQPDGVNCADCQKCPPAFTRARAPFHYAFPVDTALKKLKFRRQLLFAPAFAELLLPVIDKDFAECDALVPVPLHRWRHVTRGFNQADELCKTLARHTALPIVMSVARTRATGSQSGLSAAERHRNLRNAFAVRGTFQYRYPLIVDDVITTGTTCNELAKVLLDAGAARVGVLAVAHSSLTP